MNTALAGRAHQRGKRAGMAKNLPIWDLDERACAVFYQPGTEDEEKKQNCLRYFEQACQTAQWMGAAGCLSPGAQANCNGAACKTCNALPEIEKLEAQGLYRRDAVPGDDGKAGADRRCG
ncbi:MAG: hypothetical protein ACLT0Y_07935 [Christensenellales bacterium]